MLRGARLGPASWVILALVVLAGCQGSSSPELIILPTATPTAASTSTPTASLAATATPTATATFTPAVSPTRTASATPMPTATRAPTGTPTPAATRTPAPTPTATPTPALTATRTPTATATVSPLGGTVQSGLTPIAGSTVTLFEVGRTGNGSAPIQIAQTVTDAGGNWFLGAVTCNPVNAPLYMTAVGGNAGAGVNNALVLISALGPCNSLPVGFTVNIDEVTTVASVWLLSQFMNCGGGVVDGKATGAPQCTASSRDIGASASNAIGLSNATAPINNLVDLPNGVTKVSSGAMLLPSSKINTLGDVLHDCVGSAGGASTACRNLFTCAVPGAIPGTGNLAPCTPPAGAIVPTDTLAATLDIVLNPVNNVAALFKLASKTPPYLPMLAAAPNDWTLAITISGGGMNEPGSVAIDANGHAWVANFGNNSVTEISAAGAFLSGANGFTGGGLSGPAAIAIDPNGSAWVANSAGFPPNSVTKISPAGVFLSGPKGFVGGGLDEPSGIAIDAAGNAWATNLVTSTVTKLSPSGVFLSGSSGFAAGGLGAPFGIAIDATGNAWVANANGGSVTEISPVGISLSGAGGYAGGGLNQPVRIAIDPSGNAWVTNQAGASVTEVSPEGTFLSGLAGYHGGGLNQPFGIAIDAAGKAWVANLGATGLTELSAAGIPLSNANGFQAAGLARSQALAIDASGNVWVPNNPLGPGNTSITEFLGLATPVLTPMSVCLARHSGSAICAP